MSRGCNGGWGTDEGGELEGLGVVDDGSSDGDTHRRLPLRIRLLRRMLPLLLMDGFLPGLAAVVLRGVFALQFLFLFVLVSGLLASSCLDACRIHGVGGGGGGGDRPGLICGVVAGLGKGFWEWFSLFWLGGSRGVALCLAL